MEMEDAGDEEKRRDGGGRAGGAPATFPLGDAWGITMTATAGIRFPGGMRHQGRPPAARRDDRR